MKTPRKTRAPGFAILAALATVVAVAVLAASAKPASSQENAFVGIDQCAACHEDTVAAFKESIHGQKGFAMRSNHACETCHGPGKTHVDAGGGKGTMKTVAGLTVEERSQMCLACHDRGQRMEWSGSVHETRGLSCQDCHSIHHPGAPESQLKKPETDLCFGCHKQKKAEFFRSSHHPVREGQMTCSNCHDPHQVDEGKIVDLSAVDEACYRCHAEKRGPFLWDHVPVRENCATCHEPHGSNHMKMLRAKEPFLCQRCHSETRHPGTLYDQSQLLVDSNRLFGRSCTNCHATLHGSNHPSGKFFLR